MEHDDAELLTSFLVPMMNYYPDARATPADLIKHPWLDGVVVQGDIDMAERAHKAEIERLQGVREATEKNKERVPIEEIAKLGPAVKGMVGMGRI